MRAQNVPSEQTYPHCIGLGEAGCVECLLMRHKQETVQRCENHQTRRADFGEKIPQVFRFSACPLSLTIWQGSKGHSPSPLL